jgi:DNA helicase-2/ATP-dependent DNA helicase PcrA
VDLLSNLNPEQLRAVTLGDQSALILAGAGSGKTRVLTTRIAWLLSTSRARPAEVLAVTFTNKAAREMQTRLSAMLPVNTRTMWIGTFHGLCNRFLRIQHREAGLPQTFQILDTQDQLGLIKRMYKSIGVDDNRYPPRTVQYFISDSKEQGLRPNQVEATDSETRGMVELYAAYEDACRREGAVDFGELLLRSYEVLAASVPLREHYQRRFRHLLVDEFQDTNLLQYKWLKMLASDGKAAGARVFAVGDDDQSIYAFRGADTGNMQRFQGDYSPVELIKLEQNYRSHGNILDAANALIRNNESRLGKNLWTQEGAGEPLRVYIAANESEEATFVVDTARELREQGVNLSELAVLYRSNAQSRSLEHALFNAGMPYRVYGGMRFFERAEIKHALAYMRLLANPDDDGALLRVINFPPRGIGARTLETLTERATGAGTSLWQAACSGGSRTSAKAGGSIAGFVQLIESMRHATADLTLPEIAEHVIAKSGLVPHYESEREGQERIENLRELVSAAESFASEAGGTAVGGEAALIRELMEEEARAGQRAGDATGASSDAAAIAPRGADGAIGESAPPALESAAVESPAQGSPAPESPAPEPPPDVLTSFLTHAALEAGDTQSGDPNNALQLMTVHSAKGLEFHTVFITGLEEGLFPHENSMSDPGGLEEERRLMYVALTRARRRLYLTQSQSRTLHGQFRYNISSRFLDEIPKPLLQWLSAPANLFAEPSGYRSPAAHAPASPMRGRTSQSSAATSDSPFRIGQNVVHAKFGSGVIVNAEGRGPDARVQVNFRDWGLKWLALEFARLEAA